MRKILLYAAFLIPVILVAGCSTSTTQGFSDVGLEVKIDAPAKALPNQVIEIRVLVTNRLEGEVKDVVVRLADPFGLTTVSTHCDPPEKDATPTSCYYLEILPGDDREIVFRLRTPEEGQIARTEQALRPEIAVEYETQGQTVMIIPIVKAKETATVTTKYSQSAGPIKVNIEKGLTVSTEETEGDIVREGSVSLFVVNFNDVVGTDSPVTIEKNKFAITLENLETQSDLGRCDFEGTDVLTLKEDVPISQARPLSCVLEAGTIEDKLAIWVLGKIQADFSYRYKKIEPVDIQVITTLIS